MAYRFLLEVPSAFEQDVNAAVGSVDDAQVLVSRISHGLGIDVPYKDFTIAAHSLAIIPVLYGIADDIGAIRPDSRTMLGIVLHSGRRVGFHEVDAPTMVATIRRDQPWVDRSMPKIGDHEPNERTLARRRLRDATGGGVSLATAPDTLPQLPAVQSVIIERSQSQFEWKNEEFIEVPVTNIAGAEKFYFDVLGLNLVCRLKRDALGNWRELPLAYDHDEANYHDSEADRILLEHGVLRLALVRAGHGARLDYSKIDNHLSLLVDPDVLARLRATVLMRGYDVLEDKSGDLTFRDPYGVAWSVTDHAARVDR